MSDPNSTTPATGDNANQTPDGGAGATSATNTPQQAASLPQQSQPFKSFASQDELNEFMQERVSRAERNSLDRQAKELGYRNWAHMRALVQTIDADDSNSSGGANGEPDGGQAQPPQQPGTDSNAEAERLRMALKVGAELNLPATLVGRLQGDTEEAMRADAETLQALVQFYQQQGPGIPAPPPGGQAVTFTREQLKDPKFVREHADEIRAAHAQGRIVNS